MPSTGFPAKWGLSDRRRDDSENFASKMNLRSFGLCHDYSSSLIYSNVGELSRGSISKNHIQVSGLERAGVLLFLTFSLPSRLGIVKSLMMSEERAQKFRTDDVSLFRSG